MKGNIWAQVLGRLEPNIKRHDFIKWLQPTALAADEGDVLEVRVPDDTFGGWIQKFYGAAIQEALTASAGQARR
jgi:chromosomal replication initiation ATPase DnaA